MPEEVEAVPQLKNHVDEFTLLRLKAGELATKEARATSEHLEECLRCRGALRSVETLDSELRDLAKSGELVRYLETHEFDPSDPFRRRPLLRVRRRPPVLGPSIKAAGVGRELSDQIMKELEGGLSPADVLKELRLETSEGRFALYYALQNSGHVIAGDPVRSLDFATAVLELKPPPAARDSTPAVDDVLGWSMIQAQAHALAAQAHLWFREYAKAGAHLVVAYRVFAREGDETAVSMIELVESQRRFFLGEGEGALSLARRARASLEGRGLDDLSARAAVAEGMALATSGRFAEAVAAYREALPVFERFELWSNYVGALNSLATALYRMGRLDDARREFARVFRRFSRTQHRSWLGYLRYGLGDILFAAGRYREAARAFARASQIFEACGLRASALSAAVVEAESWACHGSIERANARLASVARKVKRDKTLDPSVKEAIARALSRLTAGRAAVAAFQEQLQSLLRSS